MSATGVEKSKNQLADDFDYPFCRDVTVHYEKIAKIGQGTFGYVEITAYIYIL